LRRLLLILFLCATFASTVSAQVTINQTTAPVVTANGTTTFTASVVEGGGVTWSCPGCAGSINSSTGVYTAPATIHTQNSYAGYQLLPNDHIYNTRVDSLSVNSNSATWIAGAGSGPFSVGNDSFFPFNYYTNSTPTQAMLFDYTPGNNGLFQIPAYPGIKLESGWFTRLNTAQFDHHLMGLDTTSGTFQEVYDPAPAGHFGDCLTCNALSGIRYLASTYGLPNSQGGATDAAGMYIIPLILRLQEMENAIATSGTIKHALRMTLQNGFICNSSTANACGGNAAGTRFIWPATSFASAGGGVVPYGARFRLKAAFDISGYSADAQIILTALKQYGLILADGGAGWATQVEDTKWPADILAAFSQINSRNIAPSNFEAVDESGLEVSGTSGATTSSETVVATGVTNPAHTAKQQVVLQGVTVGLPNDVQYIQANTAAQQLVAYVNGGALNTVTWSSSPSTVGTLTSGGLFTPPTSTGGLGTPTATDNFTRANSSTLGANWSNGATVGTSLGIISNKASNENSGGGQASSVYTGTSFSNDQFSAVTLSVIPDADAQCTVRESQVAATYYAGGFRSNIDLTHYVLYKRVAGTPTQIGATSSLVVTAGDQIECMASQSTVSLYVNQGSGWVLAVQGTDTSIASGSPGLLANNTSGNIGIFTSWSGGTAPPPLTTTITATSNDDNTVSASMTMQVLPTGSIFLRPGSSSTFSDTSGNVWLPTGGDTGSLECCGDTSSQPWPSASVNPNIPIYYYQQTPVNDMRFDISVPNGNYYVKLKWGGSGSLGTFETQGNVYFTNVVSTTLAGGQWKPIDLAMPAVVTNGVLSFVARQSANLQPGSGGVYVNGLEIDPISGGSKLQ
jgi:hypothetical protein